MSETQEKQKANWIVRHQIVEDGAVTGFVDISDKGALKLSSVNGLGQERFIMCIMPAQLPYFANFDFAAIMNSPEYKQIREEATKAQARAKLEQKTQKAADRELLKLQAQVEKLAQLGIKVQVG